MNVLYVLGNGFDKAQGMATSYPEFYTYLTDKVQSGSYLLGLMKSEISQNNLLWSDMEERLGGFTNITDDAEQFADFYFELSDYLQFYLKQENDKFSPSDRLRLKFQEDFTMPGKYLGSLDVSRYNAFCNPLSSRKDISVMTLNYTDTLEKILGLRNGVKTKQFGGGIYLRDIIHVHGRLGDSVIIGVDNEKQILNESFRNNDDIKDILIKLQSNLVMKYTRHMQCEKYISVANLIVLFGVSLGDTDARWWQLIGKNLIKRKDLAIIQHIHAPEALRPTRRQLLGKLERQHQQLLMNKMRIKKDAWTEELRNRLFFIVNEPIFRL